MRLICWTSHLLPHPTTHARHAQLQRPWLGSSQTTTNRGRMQTRETAWASYWPDSSLGKVNLQRKDKLTGCFLFCHLTTHWSFLSSYFSSWLHRFCNLLSLMLCLSPTIWHVPPPSCLLSPSTIFPYLLLLVLSFCVFHFYVLLFPPCSLLPLRLPHLSPSWPHSMLPLSLWISVSLSNQLCVTGRPAELTGLRQE